MCPAWTAGPPASPRNRFAVPGPGAGAGGGSGTRGAQPRPPPGGLVLQDSEGRVGGASGEPPQEPGQSGRRQGREQRPRVFGRNPGGPGQDLSPEGKERERALGVSAPPVHGPRSVAGVHRGDAGRIRGGGPEVRPRLTPGRR
ncbi:hypothetical protein GCM10009605_24660 [Nocardiopsis composta]